MERISTAKLAKAQNAALAARPYAAKLAELAAAAAGAAGQIQHPLLEAHAQPKNALLIVLTSDRGLCGAFNANIIKQARTLIASLKNEGRQLQFIVQGKKGVGAFRFLKLPLAERLIGVSDKPSYARAEALAEKLIAAYAKHELDEVFIVYSAFKVGGQQVAKQERILPLAGTAGAQDKKAPKAEKPAQDILFHPDPKTILEGTLPLVVKMAIFKAMLENAASEQAARRVAMKNATDSADEMILSLTRAYNRARQGKITSEIAEIVGGANALE
jgi:F-type H+-transporting ATPase subunit gamma